MHMCTLYKRDNIRYMYKTLSVAPDFLQQRQAKLQAIHLNKTVSSELHILTYLTKIMSWRRKIASVQLFSYSPNSCENQSLASVKCLCSTEFSRTKAAHTGWNPRQGSYMNELCSLIRTRHLWKSKMVQNGEQCSLLLDEPSERDGDA